MYLSSSFSHTSLTAQLVFTSRTSTGVKPNPKSSGVLSLFWSRSQSRTRTAYSVRDSDFPTLPRELSSTDKMYYKKEQLEKDKELVQMHTDFSPVL